MPPCLSMAPGRHSSGPYRRRMHVLTAFLTAQHAELIRREVVSAEHALGHAVLVANRAGALPGQANLRVPVARRHVGFPGRVGAAPLDSGEHRLRLAPEA